MLSPDGDINFLLLFSHGVIILVYQCNNGISRSDGTFVSMLEMGYRDGRESASNTLIHSLHRLRRQ
jgi:hypothetical protein